MGDIKPKDKRQGGAERNCECNGGRRWEVLQLLGEIDSMAIVVGWKDQCSARMMFWGGVLNEHARVV